MNLFVESPEWGWWIILYFFLGGIAAGSYFMATLIELMGSKEDRDLARIGYWLAFPLIILCAFFLTVDLNQPTRFWHMLFRSEVVHQARAEGWPLSGGWGTFFHSPLVKVWSPMSLGSWALTLFGACSFLSFLASIRTDGRFERVFRQGVVSRILQVVGCLAGLFVASYTGSLLSATNQPIWSDSVWIAPLFLTSAASSSIAALLLIAKWKKIGTPASLVRLEQADLWALLLELVVFAIFLASLGPFLMPFLHTINGKLFIAATLGFGILIPVAIHLRIGDMKAWAMPIAAASALVGGFLFRYAIVKAPEEILKQGPAVLASFSPEDYRARGGGPGADPHNAAGEITPRSKLTESP